MENDKTDKRKPKVSDHLANQRTFLAWIRTSIALMGFGFVIVKFAVFLREMTQMVGQTVKNNTRESVIVGIFMVILGALAAILGYVQFYKVHQQIENESYKSSQSLNLTLTLLVVVLSSLLIFYLFSNI
ncbi:MAG: DUF202 domain-containing protein [Petrimonas sp.]|nr:DUF202 domain-containing protein [Petrimonas sp.]